MRRSLFDGWTLTYPYYTFIPSSPLLVHSHLERDIELSHHAVWKIKLSIELIDLDKSFL